MCKSIKLIIGKKTIEKKNVITFLLDEAFLSTIYQIIDYCSKMLLSDFIFMCIKIQCGRKLFFGGGVGGWDRDVVDWMNFIFGKLNFDTFVVFFYLEMKSNGNQLLLLLFF